MRNTHLAGNGMCEINFISHKQMQTLSKVLAWVLIVVGLLSVNVANAAPTPPALSRPDSRVPIRPAPLKKYLAYLQQSLEQRTQWVVGKPDTETLWARMRLSIEDFLYREWMHGHLQGTRPAEAYRVRCDRSTMTQNDIQLGKVICVIGVAPIRPAEFEILRVVQQAVPAP